MLYIAYIYCNRPPYLLYVPLRRLSLVYHEARRSAASRDDALEVRFGRAACAPQASTWVPRPIENRTVRSHSDGWVQHQVLRFTKASSVARRKAGNG